MQKKYFTVKEANELLPSVNKKLLKLIKIQKALKLVETIEISYADDFEAAVKDIDRNKRFHELSVTFCTQFQELLAMGVYVKDIEFGLIDFYSRYKGQDIFLCYKLGEEKIAFWHDVTTGFAGRKPVQVLEEEQRR